MFKKLNGPQLEVIVKLFNRILNSGIFPKEWAIGIIVPIFEKGTTSDLNNYRGITLLRVSEKLLTGSLNVRLEKLVDTFSILEETQVGFRKRLQGYWSYFYTYAIITHFVHAENRSLYACFVDFKKAFDKVSHALFWHKLMQLGLGGKFLALVKEMYAQVKSCVRANYWLTCTFKFEAELGKAVSPYPICTLYERFGKRSVT